MTTDKCLVCEDLLKVDADGKPLCFYCEDFSSSKYVDTLTTAIENGTISMDDDIVKEYKLKCKKGKCKGAKKEKISFSDAMAIGISNTVGSMTFFWFTVVLATIPLIWKATMPIIGYISSGYLQLILLPILSIGTRLLSKDADKRSELDFRSQIRTAIEIQRIGWQLSRVLRKLEGFKNNRTE